MTLQRFLLNFIALTVFAGATAAIMNNTFTTGVLVPKFWVIFGFLAGITVIAFVLSSIGIKKGGEISIYSVMGGIILKLLLSMVFVLVYLLKFRVNSVNFAVQFFSLYFLFTAFEVYALLRNLRDQNKT